VVGRGVLIAEVGAALVAAVAVGVVLRCAETVRAANPSRSVTPARGRLGVRRVVGVRCRPARVRVVGARW